MKIATRLQLLSWANLLGMSLAVMVAVAWWTSHTQRDLYERMLELELTAARQAVARRLDAGGMLAAGYEAAAQARQLREQSGWASARLALIDTADRSVIYHPDHPFGTRLADDEPLDTARADRLARQELIEPLQWALVLSIDRREVYAALPGVLLPVGAIMLAALGISTLVFNRHGGRLLRRTRDIASVVEAVEQGDLKARGPSDSPDDELGDLQRSVNAMAQRLEERTLAQARTQAASDAKSNFLANMSHEIRTPLNAVLGLTHLMQRDTRDPVHQDRLRKVEGAARHLLQLVNDVLDLSKIEAGKMMLERVEFDMDALLSRAFELVRAQAADKRLELVLDFDHMPRQLVGDPTRLLQVLVNLLSNAVKFTARGWVQVRSELVDARGNTLNLRFEVTDTGEGIAADRLDEIFAAFEQADNTITRRHGGSGLGLTLCRHLVRMMGGDVGVSSVPGQGSTFWFNCRLSPAPDAVATKPEVLFDGMRVLLLDDLPVALSSVARMLGKEGLEVCECARPATALERVRHCLVGADAFDLLVLDWQMPELDGAEVLVRIRGLLGDTTPPALLMTALDEPAVREAAQRAGFGAVLVKPVTPSALRLALSRMLTPSGESAAAGLSEVPSDGGVAEAEARLRERHAGQRVLLVEDNLINLEVAQAMLEGVGLVVECAENGRLGAALATSRPYDLVLMDMQMPDMDGLEATRRIRGQRGAADLPIVAMTANAYADDIAACMAAGMNAHVTKPVEPQALFETLLRWLPAAGPVASKVAEDATARPVVPAAPDEPSWMAALRQVPELNVGQGLRQMANKPSLYADVLRRFAVRHGAGAPELLEAAEAADGRRLGEQCHSLRGSTSTLGAIALAESLQRLEQAAKLGQQTSDWAQQSRAIDLQVRELATAIAAVVPAG